MNDLQAVIKKSFVDFYRTLHTDEYLKQFFENVDLKKLIKKQEQNFLECLELNEIQIRDRFIDLGHVHYKIGLPYSRYIKSFQTLLKSIILYLPNNNDATKHLTQIQTIVDHAVNASAAGYLEEMIEYDLDIIGKLLNESIAQKFVTEHLFWIERVCFDIKNHRSKPSVELDETKCLLGKWLESLDTADSLDENELVRIDSMHHKVHSTAKSVYDSLKRNDYHALLIDYSFLVRHSHHINYELNQIITQKDLLTISQTDSLTTLSNRKSLEDKLAKTRFDCTHRFCIAMCDLDYFKQINDTYGQPLRGFYFKKGCFYLENKTAKR